MLASILSGFLCTYNRYHLKSHILEFDPDQTHIKSKNLLKGVFSGSKTFKKTTGSVSKTKVRKIWFLTKVKRPKGHAQKVNVFKADCHEAGFKRLLGTSIG